MAPEILKGQTATDKSDIYSLGLLMLEMITLEVPYGDEKNAIELIKSGQPPKVLEKISDEAIKKFILNLIQFDPNKRPSISEILELNILKINEKEDNRLIKLNKIKRKKNRKLQNSSKNGNSNNISFLDQQSNKYWDTSNKFQKRISNKRFYEDNNESFLKINNKDTNNKINNNDKMNSNNKKRKNSILAKIDNSPFHTEHHELHSNEIDINKMPNIPSNLVISSHEGLTQSNKYNSDMYNTNEDYLKYFAKETELQEKKNSDLDSLDGINIII